MSTLNATRCIGIGLLGLPLYGTLFFWSSFDGQPDPDTQLGAWSRFVSTDYYVYSHLLTALSLIYGQTISPARTPFTVPLGTVVVAISGGWMALSVMSRPSSAPVGAAAQPRVR